MTELYLREEEMPQEDMPAAAEPETEEDTEE